MGDGFSAPLPLGPARASWLATKSVCGHGARSGTVVLCPHAIRLVEWAGRQTRQSLRLQHQFNGPVSVAKQALPSPQKEKIE